MSPQNVLSVRSVSSVSIDVLQRKTMDCFSSIFFLSFQDFYTIVLNELVLEVVARHRDDILAQPSCLHCKTDVQNCKQTKCVNKFGTENDFILDYLSESSRHEANILSKWVWIFSYKTGYHTALNKQKPTSHDKLLMAPQIKHN
jgi:hypothetical protein